MMIKGNIMMSFFHVIMCRGPPIELIVQHAYQNDWIKMNQWLSENYPDLYEFAPTKWKPSPTNSSLLRVEAAYKLCNKPPTKPKFCMNRFKNIKKRIDNECNIPFIRDRVYPNLTHWETPTNRCSLKTSKCGNKHATWNDSTKSFVVLKLSNKPCPNFVCNLLNKANDIFQGMLALRSTHMVQFNSYITKNIPNIPFEDKNSIPVCVIHE